MRDYISFVFQINVMKKLLKPKNILMIVIVFLAVAQFFKIDKTNPTVESSLDFVSVVQPPLEIGNMIIKQCYDCHSYETKYPWYSDIAPVSWWLKSNINGAREELNFSEWALYSEKEKTAKMQEIAEALEEGEMPVTAYVLMHDSAQFSDEKNALLLNWVKNY